MRSAEFVLALLIAVVAPVTIARRLGIAYPIFLVIGGLLLGLVPGLPRPHGEPDLIFLLVLDPLHDGLLHAAAQPARAPGQAAIDDDAMRSLERELDLEAQRMDA